jgi:long-chain acyl-CoA synthetase
LHTGDLAELREGLVYIRGRKKDILVLSTGENVNPGAVESAILADPLVEQVCVLGNSRAWCAAVVVVDPAGWKDWAKSQRLDPEQPNDPKARESFLRRLGDRMGTIPPFARVRGVVIETEPWSLDSGLITPTLKAKRAKIVERYKPEFDNLFGSH